MSDLNEKNISSCIQKSINEENIKESKIFQPVDLGFIYLDGPYTSEELKMFYEDGYDICFDKQTGRYKLFV